ncbi:MAG: hypothetical protein LBQ54_08515 [Planctomycetaceae bacterium]|nr:hypothetical protein [Planctomycetaceae bacterium]
MSDWKKCFVQTQAFYQVVENDGKFNMNSEDNGIQEETSFDFEPVFDFVSNNSSILLDKGTATLNVGDKRFDLNVETKLDLIPRPRIDLYVSFDTLGVYDAISTAAYYKNERCIFQRNNEDIEVLLLNCPYEENSCWNVKCSPSSVPMFWKGKDDTKIDYLIFHLFNFPDFLGTRHSCKKHKNGSCTIQHIDLHSNDWDIELKSLHFTMQNIKSFKKDGINQLSHVGCIKRPDRTPFQGNEASECLQIIRYFLAFAKGTWCNPVCAVGFNDSKERVWESWASSKSVDVPFVWFDHYHGEQLQLLFPLFMKKWVDKHWHDSLHTIIYWYVNANDIERGIEGCLILAQAAFELLSYEVSVNEKRLIWSRSFKDMLASDKFRMLFSTLHIPIDIPDETSEMKKLAKELKWLDAPHALTEIRNSLVHPVHKNRKKFNRQLLMEAWKLSLWYLELGILAVCGYTRTYGNRLKNDPIGTVDKVPWI